MTLAGGGSARFALGAGPPPTPTKGIDMSQTANIDDVLSGRARWCVVTGDCLQVLPTIPAGSVGACLCDPPFGISHSSNHGASWNGTRIQSDHDTSARDAALEWASAMPWAAFGTWKTPPPANVRGCLVWDKGPASGMGDLSFPWKPSWELVYLGGEGWVGSRDEGVIRGHTVVTWESQGRAHPHAKPESLYRMLLDKLPGVEVVIDPFCGCAPSGVAAVKSGRRFVGIEISPEYAAIARRRIAEAADTLWTPPPPKPEQVEMFA